MDYDTNYVFTPATWSNDGVVTDDISNPAAIDADNLDRIETGIVNAFKKIDYYRPGTYHGVESFTVPFSNSAKEHTITIYTGINNLKRVSIYGKCNSRGFTLNINQDDTVPCTGVAIPTSDYGGDVSWSNSLGFKLTLYGGKPGNLFIKKPSISPSGDVNFVLSVNLSDVGTYEEVECSLELYWESC